MDDVNPPAPSRQDIERRIIDGWSAIEQGDLERARAALQDVHAVDPAHPALPLLAAGIRRIRPKPIPWRQAIIFLLLMGAGVLAVGWWTGRDGAMPPQTTAPIASTPAAPPSTTGTTGTAGRVPRPTTPAPASAPATAPRSAAAPPPAPNREAAPSQTREAAPQMDDAVLIRQAVKRFEDAYRGRWGVLTLRDCDVARESETAAAATCHARQSAEAPDADANGVWTFALRKTGSAWKIVSVQPPPAR
jgi:hypothetical protein